MIDDLIKLGQQELGGKLKQDENLDEDQVNTTFNVAQQSMLEGLLKEAQGGHMGFLKDLFNGKGEQQQSNSLMDSVLASFIPKLAQRLNIPESQAKAIGSAVIPMLVKKFQSPETGEVKDEQELANKFNLPKGLDKEGDGFDLGDAIDLAGGLFGKKK